MNNKTDRKSDWQREFDERIKGWVVDGTIEGYQVEVLKHFISNLFSKQREQLVEEIEKNRPKEKIKSLVLEKYGIRYIQGYNQALKEYDKIITDTLK